MTLKLANIDALTRAVRQSHLDIVGMVSPNDEDPVPAGTETILLLGPQEPGFWEYVSRQPEFLDRNPDPIDRWSQRVISGLANAHGGTAIFPYGGPPYAPFIAWALRSGRAWASPVTLLVHDTVGLFLSFRGAICLPDRLEQSPLLEKPCDTCDAQPCRTACLVNALTAKGYDLDACHGYLDSQAGRDCMGNGCAVRRACPVSQAYARLPEQSAHHMKAFHK